MQIRRPHIYAIVGLLVTACIIAWVLVHESRGPKKPGKPKPAVLAPAQPKPPSVPREVADRYRKIASLVNENRLREAINRLGSVKSRVAGYPGADKAADYVLEEFRRIGLEDVRAEAFDVTVPVDRGASLQVGGRTFTLYGMWPNLVRTSQLPPEGVACHLIYASRARLPDFKGKNVDGSGALIDFNCGTEWLNAPRLGAKLVIFIEPDTTMRGEAEAKFSAIPVSIPRFWVSRADAETIKRMIAAGQAGNALVKCSMPWERREARNIIAKIEGTDPRLRKQIIVINSFYDGMSVVPGLAPSAESACGMSALFELARVLKQFPPKRTVWFIATAGHFLSLAGMRAYINRHLEAYERPGVLDNFRGWLNRRWPAGHGGLPIHFTALAIFAAAALVIRWSWRKVGRGRRGAIVVAPVALLLLSAYAGVRLNQSLSRGFAFKVPNPPDIYLFLGLDLTSQTEGVGLLYKGYFYDYREDIQSNFSDIATKCREHSDRVAVALGFYDDRASRFADGVNQPNGKIWRNFIPGKIALDSEVAVLAGSLGLSFVSTDDTRPFVDTPFDTPDRVNVPSLSKQVTMIACLLDHVVRDPNNPGGTGFYRMPVTEPGGFSRMTLQGGFAELGGQAVRFDPKRSFVPNLPVPDCLAVVRSAHKSFMGVRANMIEATLDHGRGEEWKRRHPDSVGRFRFEGVAPLTAYGYAHPTSIAAYNIDPKTGDIAWAPDQGVYGEFYKTDFDITTGVKETPVILFHCVSSSIYDLIDPQGLKALSTIDLYDGDTNGSPRMFGVALAVPEPRNPHVENMAVIFTQPHTRLKIIMGSGPAATRLVLINSRLDPGGALKTFPAHAEGVGYDVGNGITFKHTALNVTQDLWNLDEFRIRRLAKYRIINEGIDVLHEAARTELAAAQAALKSNDYSTFDSRCRAAWGYEIRAYPEVQKTAKDVVNGVLFYMVLMLPFAYFAERLLFASTKLWRQILWFFLIFLAVFLVFRYVHPAFDITMNPIIVLLAFIMLALSALVIFLIGSKFEDQIKAFNQQVSGVHKADIGRMSVAAAAFSLGISNMRRRKARTILTCVTLILLTFTVLSFTSIVQVLRFNKVPAKHEEGAYVYDGVMIRTAMWEPLQEIGYQLMNDEFGTRYPVAPRAWFYGAQLGEQSFLTLRRGSQTYDARAAAGLTPQEAVIMDLNGRNRNVFVAGRWFGYGAPGAPGLASGDTSARYSAPDTPAPYEMIVPTAIADKLKIKPEDVGKAKVTFAGTDYTVIGIIDNKRFKTVTDLDSEPLTPVDFILMNKLTSQGKSMGEAGFRQYTHLEPDNTFYIPYQTAMNLGADLRSLAIGFVTADEVKARLNELMPRLGLNLYAGMNNAIFRYSSIAGTSSKGFHMVSILVLIAALIVLNTMLGSVYERVREIGIFSSIGLAPTHIAVLFMAEAMVYAILGAVAGYVLGQGASKLLTVTHLLPGLYLNFSSQSAVWSTMIVVAVVIGSTLYPARKASEVATPAIERSWRVADPDGDLWRIALPFAVTGEQARGVNGFLVEWFRAYEDYSVGDFVTEGVSANDFESDCGQAYRVSCKAWLAPFDLGVSQQVVLETLPTPMADVFEVKLSITRESGDVSNWKRVNRRFLNTLRKQFLIWRTLRHEERQKYLAAEAVGV